MADQKISALPAFTAASVNDDDQFIINDSSSGSYETKRISFSQLAGTVGGTSGAQYLTFFQGDRTDPTDNGVSYNNDGWWGDISDSGAPVEIASETQTFIAPANSIGAIVMFCSRMSHKLSDNVQDMPFFNTGSQFNMKCFANCTQTTPECYWNTRGQANTTINGFAQRLITKVVPEDRNKNFDFQTYHSAKWDYVDWAAGPSEQDRTFKYTVAWSLDELGWSRVGLGQNRVIILPFYEDPQVGTFVANNFVDPFDSLAAGIRPLEYQLRSDQLDEFNQLNNQLAGESLNREESERAILYKEAMDKIQRNASGYISQYDGSNEQDEDGTLYQLHVDNLKIILSELYALKTSTSLIDVIETEIYGDKTKTPGTAEYLGLYGRTAEIVGFYWPFDNTRGPSF